VVGPSGMDIQPIFGADVFTGFMDFGGEFGFVQSGRTPAFHRSSRMPTAASWSSQVGDFRRFPRFGPATNRSARLPRSPLPVTWSQGIDAIAS
jgi:hypothetical protein